MITFVANIWKEGKSIVDLLNTVKAQTNGEHRYACLFDKSGDRETVKWALGCGYTIFEYNHVDDNSEKKNWLNSQLTTDWVFHFDGDELPGPKLIPTLLIIDKANHCQNDCFWIPRLNIVDGMTAKDAAEQGFQLCMVNGQVAVNWPDLQGRLYKRDKVKWEGRAHDRLVGSDAVGSLPRHPDYAIIHTKTIAKQIDDNIRWNSWR